jgi:hypothetical protein
MRTETITRTLYEYDELPDNKKYRALEWYREGGIDAANLDFVIEDVVRVGELLGLTFKTHTVKLHGGGTREEPNIWYSLNDSGASFDARYQYRKGMMRYIKAYAPEDKVLHSIAERLLEDQRKSGYKLEATITAVSGHRLDVCCSYSVSTRAFADFTEWIEVRVREEYEYQNSDECVEENIRANGYEFLEDGSRA